MLIWSAPLSKGLFWLHPIILSVADFTGQEQGLCDWFMKVFIYCKFQAFQDIPGVLAIWNAHKDQKLWPGDQKTQ